MPYKNTEDRKAYNKKYRLLKGKETDLKRTKTLQDRLNALSPEEQETFIKKRRETTLKSYYKHRDKILEKNKSRSIFYRLKSSYGITEEQYYELLKDQNKQCAICGCKEHEKRWTSSKLPFAVDHCHTTNKVRGLLCDACNVMLGHAYNDPKILEKAINYLKLFKTNE